MHCKRTFGQVELLFRLAKSREEFELQLGLGRQRLLEMRVLVLHGGQRRQEHVRVLLRRLVLLQVLCATGVMESKNKLAKHVYVHVIKNKTKCGILEKRVVNNAIS